MTRGFLDSMLALKTPAAPPPAAPPQAPSAVDFARRRLGFEPDPKQQLVLSGSITRGILNCTRQWGKSTTTALKAVHRAFTYPDSLTLVVSPSGRQSAEFLRKAGDFLRRLDIQPRGDGDNEISLLLPNRSRIVGLPGKESTIRGFSAVSLLLIDEAARVPDSLYRAVRPMLAVTAPNQPPGQLWLMSTPCGCRGFFFEEWTGVTPLGVPLKPDPWTRITATAYDCPRISPEYLAEERAANEALFRQEYMCEFIEEGESIFGFSQEEIDDLTDDTSGPLFDDWN